MERATATNGATESGKLECSEDSLSYRSTGNTWTLRLSEIRLIGEYTNADGPFLDDYFFVFLTAPENGWHEASFYAKGRVKAFKSLAQKLGAPFDSGLCHSTVWNSRILWPPELCDQELMEVLPPKPGFWRKLFDSGERDLRLSKSALKAFK